MPTGCAGTCTFRIQCWLDVPQLVVPALAVLLLFLVRW
jgi:hypothetical protein